jgi:hypothetical protein
MHQTSIHPLQFKPLNQHLATKFPPPPSSCHSKIWQVRNLHSPHEETKKNPRKLKTIPSKTRINEQEKSLTLYNTIPERPLPCSFLGIKFLVASMIIFPLIDLHFCFYIPVFNKWITPQLIERKLCS